MCKDIGAEVFYEIPEFASLSEGGRERLREISREMLRRNLPPEVLLSGLRSTAALLFEQESAERVRIQSPHVQEFLEANGGKQIARTARAVPRRETKVVARERLHERLNSLLTQARSARRKHEIMSVRRDLLGVEQAYVRRILGVDANVICDEMNEWLADVATRINNGGL